MKLSNFKFNFLSSWMCIYIYHLILILIWKWKRLNWPFAKHRFDIYTFSNLFTIYHKLLLQKFYHIFIYLFFFINVLQLGIIKRLHDHSIMIYNRHLIFMNYIFLNFPFFKTRLSILVLLKILVISLMGIWCAIPVIETFSNLTDIEWCVRLIILFLSHSMRNFTIVEKLICIFSIFF